MKEASRKTKQRSEPIKYPVPVWMDSDLKSTAERLDVLQRHALADKFERQALQLREMKPPEIKRDVNYCNAEGINQCEFAEKAIGEALDKWQAEPEQEA
jgi:hypothetical protein